nr:hypothetical protein CFP56_76060 [Quercus suber]
MPRNLYRTPATLPLVYTHYDRLAFALVHAARHIAPSPLTHAAAAGLQARALWMIMPLQHAEHLPSHALAREILDLCGRVAAEKHDEQAVEMLSLGESSLQDHLLPLQRFGRYPHRNDALGRASTAEETEFMRTGKTFGVQQGGGSGGKKEDGERGREEL